jgi:hypothetical protein
MLRLFPPRERERERERESNLVRIIPMFFVCAGLVVAVTNADNAFAYKYVGNKTAAYNKKINGGKGCFLGDCSKRQARLDDDQPAARSCSFRADSCRRKNSLNPNMASRCEPARIACLRTGTFVTLSGRKITGVLRE